MNTSSITSGDYFQLFLFIFLALTFFHQFWANVIQKRISIFSIDRIIVFLSDIFASHKNKIETRKLSKDPSRLIMQGILALLTFLGFLREIYKWVLEHS